MLCKFFIFLLLFIVTTTGSADEATMNRFLSGDSQVRRVILNEMILRRREYFSSEELLFLAHQAKRSTEQEGLRTNALEAIVICSTKPPTYGAPLKRLPDNTTEVLFEIVKEKDNPKDVLGYAAACLLLSMDNSEQGVKNEKRMIAFLNGEYTGKVSEVYHTHPRHFPLQRDGISWKSIISTLKSDQVNEKWRFQLYDSLEVMGVVKLLKHSDFDQLLQIAYANPNCNVHCRIRILAKEGLMRFRNGPGLDPPDWVNETVMEHYLSDKLAGSELDYFVSKLAIFPTDNEIVVEKAIERVLDANTPAEIRKDSLEIIVNFQGDRKTVLHFIDPAKNPLE